MQNDNINEDRGAPAIQVDEGGNLVGFEGGE